MARKRMVALALGLIACGAKRPEPVLPPAPVSAIDGTVLLTGSADASLVTVTLSQGQEQLAEVTTGADGAYHFDLEKTGVYTLGFHDDYSVERDYSFEVLVDGSVRAADTTLTPLGVIRSLARPLPDCPGFNLQVLVRGFPPTSYDDSGATETVVPIGPHEVLFGIPNRTYLERFEVEVTHAATTIVAPTGPASWRLREGSIRGVVTRAPAPPPAGAVVKIDQPCSRTTVTDATGAYSFSSLPTGPNSVVSYAPESTWEAYGYSSSNMWRITSKSGGADLMPGVEAVVDFRWRPVVTVRGRVLSGGVAAQARICTTPRVPLERPNVSSAQAFLEVDAGTDGRYEIPAPLDVTDVHVCTPGGPQVSVPITATFGQVTDAPDLVIP